MDKKTLTDSFLNGFNIANNDIVAIIGSGGKTSLMFKLAAEAAARGMRVLVTTSTKIFVPGPHQYNAIDTEGSLFAKKTMSEPGIYVGGVLIDGTNKLTGVPLPQLEQRLSSFDLILIEADGAAEKSLKGWKDSEPVIPAFTTKTIGVIDIQVIGAEVSERLIHRLEIFSQLTGATKGETVSLSHLEKLIEHPDGLFGKAAGEKILFLNKAESPKQRNNAAILAQKIGKTTTIYGSLHQGSLTRVF